MSNENKQETTLTWHLITEGRAEVMPDTDIQVLVYDEELDDVALATLEEGGGTLIAPLWIDEQTGDPLPAPLWWADVPFPEV